MQRWTPFVGLIVAVLIAGPTNGQSRVDQMRVCNTYNGHFTTFDGYRFDHYAAGTWLMADKLDPDMPFRVEIEQAPVGPVVFISRVAARCGDHVVTAAADNGPIVWLDGSVVRDGETDVGPDGSLTVAGQRLTLRCGEHELESNHVAGSRGDFLGVKVQAAYYLTGGEPTTGFCGPFDGNAANDRPQNLNRFEWAAQFAVPEEGSLFAAPGGQAAEAPGTIFAHAGTLEFDGSNHVRHDGPFTLPPNFHVSAEVRVDESEQWNHVIEIGTLEYEWNAPLRIEVGEQGEWYVAVGDGQGYQTISKHGNWSYGQWTKLEIEYKDGALRLWEDGEYLGVTQADVRADLVSGELNLGNFARGGRHFRGAMRNVQIEEID